MRGRVAVVLGTRPEIIKLAGIVRLLGRRGYVVHTGQHYDDTLSRVFLDQFRLPEPEVLLSGVGGAARGAQFAAIIGQLTEVFAGHRPDSVVVQGDTNTAAAAAQSAYFLGIPVVHVEAGLRSFDDAMPEEINRRLVGTVASLHCAPTDIARGNLLAEGVAAGRVKVTGNTVVEATLEQLPDEAHRRDVLHAMELHADGYVLATIHRPENTDDAARLAAIMSALGSLDLPVVFPAHPRTVAALQRFAVPTPAGVRVTDPVDSARFLSLAAHARLLVSDSGGVQEECTILKRPLVVLRNSTERPEAVDTGFARRVVPGPELADELAEALADDAWRLSLVHAQSPYGDGTASEQIAKLLMT